MKLLKGTFYYWIEYVLWSILVAYSIRGDRSESSFCWVCSSLIAFEMVLGFETNSRNVNIIRTGDQPTVWWASNFE